MLPDATRDHQIAAGGYEPVGTVVDELHAAASIADHCLDHVDLLETISQLPGAQ